MRLQPPVFLMAIFLSIAQPVAAQSISLIPCWRPAIGIGIGPMVNGDRNGGGSEHDFPGSRAARNVNASVDIPVAGEWAARVEAGTVSWMFEERDFTGNVLLRDRVRLKRLTAGAMKLLDAQGPCDLPLRFYAGGGFGIYRYEYDEGAAITRGGVHLFAGMDVQLREHVSAGVAVSMHGIEGPHRKPVFSELFFAGQVSVGVKLVF
jgi:hypothetical protein